jgi:hypothetical protein
MASSYTTGGGVQPVSDVRPDETPADYGRSEPDISDLPEPDISDLPIPDTPQARQKAFEENDRQTRISHAITDTRGVIKGAASLLTAPADLGIGLVNQIKRYAYGADASTLDTNASDLLEKGLASVGLKEQKDSGLREGIMD